MNHIDFLQSIWTVVALITFVAISLWAWSGRREAQFDEAARLPFDLSSEVLSTKQQEER